MSFVSLKDIRPARQGVKKLQTIFIFLACQLDYNPLSCLWFLTMECIFEALPYNVVNNHVYHNVYGLGSYGLINLSRPQIVSLQLFKLCTTSYTRGVIISYHEWEPFLQKWPVGFKSILIQNARFYSH